MELTSSASIIVGLLLSVIVLIRTRRISKTSCGSNAVFYRIAADHILDEIPISVNVTDDMIDCIDVCVDYPKCIAINSHKRQDSKIDCHLLKDDHMSKRNKLVRKQGWNLYDTGTREISRAVGSRCLTMSTNPCPSHCTCVDTCESYRCDCYGPEIFKSCRDALKENPGNERYFWIMPEGLTAAVYSQCLKQNNSTHKMVITHNSQFRKYVSGYESPFTYGRVLNYHQNTVEDIAAVVDALGSCRQHTKIECKAMIMRNYGGLVTRDGTLLKGYVGGGTYNGQGCACGITKTCHTSTALCNCDSNVVTVLKDEGYVTNKAFLPLTGIKLGDTGSTSEYAYHTIGPLECFDTFKSCADAISSYPDGGPSYWIKEDGESKATYKSCA